MSVSQTATSPPLPPPPTHSRANPIDLTADDDDDDLHETDRKTKRMCSTDRDFNASCAPPFSPDYTRFQSYQSSGLSPAMSMQSLADSSPQPPSSVSTPLTPSEPLQTDQRHQKPMFSNWRPPFEGPSNGAAFFQPRTQPTPRPIPGPSPSSVPSTSRQVIDLTRSPSPSPASSQIPQQTHMNLPQDLSPRTPVCIGQIVSTALVLYPVPYLQAQDALGAPDSDWAPVRFIYEHNANKPADQETVHIRTPNIKSPTGEMFSGENFGVMAQKVATHLGPLLGKGLIRLDGKVRRGIPNVSD